MTEYPVFVAYGRVVRGPMVGDKELTFQLPTSEKALLTANNLNIIWRRTVTNAPARG